MKHNFNSIPFVENIINTLRSRGLHGFRNSESMHPHERHPCIPMAGSKGSPEVTSIEMYAPPKGWIWVFKLSASRAMFSITIISFKHYSLGFSSRKTSLNQTVHDTGNGPLQARIDEKSSI